MFFFQYVDPSDNFKDCYCRQTFVAQRHILSIVLSVFLNILHERDRYCMVKVDFNEQISRIYLRQAACVRR